MSEDPIGLGGGDVNFYAYVANSPLFWRDPSRMLLNGGVLGQAAARVAAKTAAGWGAAVVEPTPAGEIVMAVVTVGLGLYEIYDAHKKDARPSTIEKHEKGLTRLQNDQGYEKGEKDHPHRRRPPGWKGPWPPKKPPTDRCEPEPTPSPSPSPEE